MEYYINLTVRAVAAGYILYRVWIILFRERLFGLWDRIHVRRRVVKTVKETPIPEKDSSSRLVGKTQGNYLPDTPPVIDPVPVLPPEPEPDVVGGGEDAEDFEVGQTAAVVRPSDEELYDYDDKLPPASTDYSTGLTFEQLSDAVAFMSAPTDDDEAMMRTAETMLSIRNTDVFEIIEREISSSEAIGRLFNECLDGNGERLPKRKSKMMAQINFDIDMFI